MTTTKQPKKCVVLVTYVIAIVCLLLGLLLPFTNGSAMLATMLPSALNNVFGTTLTFGTEFAYPNAVNLFGLIELDVNSLLVLLYALITVIGIILFVPVVVCKKKKTAFVCASLVETIATAVLTLYIIMLVGTYATDNLMAEAFANIFPFDWAIICVAYCGTLIMLIIQTINYYHSDGSVKFIMWLLSALVAFCMFSVSSLTAVLANASLLVKVNGVSVSGVSIVKYFITDTFGDSTAYYFNTLGFEASTLGTIVSIALSAGIILAIFNHIVDIFCLGAKTTKGGLVFDFFRYLIELAAFVATIVILFVMSALLDCDVKPGIMLYAVTVAALFSMIISITRRADRKAKKAKVKKSVDTAEPVAGEIMEEEPAEVAAPYAPAPAEIPVPATASSPIYITFYPNYGPINPPPAPAPAPYPYPPYTVSNNPPQPPMAPHAPAAQPAQAPAAPATPAEELPEAYSGPTDAFIDKLSENEKLEFESVFIKKEKGKLNGIPDYKIGFNNKAFFNAVFLHLSTFRSMLSDGLLGKIYDETN